MQVTLLGRRWNLKFVYCGALGKDRRGECDNPDTKNRTIRVLKKLQGVERLYTVIHELCHGCSWNIGEDWIVNTSSHLAWLLTIYGWTDGPQISASSNQDARDLLATTIYHVFRAANSQFERDEWSLLAAQDIARVLWRLKYRPGEVPTMKELDAKLVTL